MRYRDRRDAGRVLAGRLGRYSRRADVTVFGLVRGGVPVAAEVAAGLVAPLDALLVRKLGVPGSPEVAFGALGTGGVRVLNEEIAGRLPGFVVEAVVAHEAAELARQELRYRRARPGADLAARVAVLVDDGLATGATARAAVEIARRLGAARVVVAVPVGALDAVDRLVEVADEVTCPATPERFSAVSRYYDHFDQVTDAEVAALLAGKA